MHVIDMAYGLGMKSLCLKGDSSRLIGAILLVHPPVGQELLSFLPRMFTTHQKIETKHGIVCILVSLDGIQCLS
jgi:hypothetical protein